MPRTLSARLAAVAAALALIAFPSALHAQKALVYCPVGLDATGCNAVVAALVGDAARFPGGADAGYDGTQGTVDLATADFSAYAVLVVPSFADGPDLQPYSLLRNGTIAGRIQAGFMGRVAVWSGTPDVGSTSRSAKDELIRNLAAWARSDAAGTHGPGVVTLQDNSDNSAARYGWLGGISALSVSADTTLELYSNVQVLTSTGQTILTNSGGLQIGYTNMASYGLTPGAGGRSDATGGRTSRMVLVTAAGAAADVSIATVSTDKDDYQPGDTISVTGAGWEPGETVSLLFHEDVDPPIHPDKTLTAVADANGNILNHQYEVDETDIGVRFTLTATGQTSGRTAQTTFTDAIQFKAVVVGTQTPTPVAPGSSATYAITVQFNGNNTPGCSVLLSVSGLPAGAAGSFSPNPVTSSGADQTSTLTITTNAVTTPPGTTTFTAQGVGTACTGTQTGDGALAVRVPTTTAVASSLNPSLVGQSVTFTASVTRTSGGSAVTTGSVTFIEGGTCAAPGTTLQAATVVNGSGQVTFTTSALTQSSHTVVGCYGGTTTFGLSSGSVLQTVNGAPDLTINKSHIGNFVVGTPATYTLTVTNSGTAPTSGTVTVTDVQPAGLSFTGATGTGWTCGGTTTITCTRSNALATSTSYPGITVNVTPTAAGAVTNTASVAGGGEVNTANDSGSDPTTVVSAIDLTINKSHSGNFTLGVNGTYTLLVSNGGGAATTGTVTVTDALPAGLGFVSASGTNWTCNNASGTVTCTRTTAIVAGGSAPNISLVVSVAEAAFPSFTNTASVSGGGEPAANNGNNSASDPTTVVAPNLAIDKSHTGSFTQGVNGTYTLAVSNTGGASTTGTITVTDVLPTGLGFVSGGNAGGWSTCTASTQTVTCTRTTAITAGTSAPNISLVVSVAAAAVPSVTNTASVSGGGEPAANNGNNSDSDPTTVSTGVDLTIDKSHTGNFTQGVNGTYSLTVSNGGGTATSASVTVTDVLPTGLGFVSGTGTGWTNCTVATQTVTCVRPAANTIAAGGVAPAITLTVSVAAAAVPSVTNTASVAGGGEPAANNGNNSDSDPTTVNAAVDLTIDKSHTGNFTEGINGVYSLTVSNGGGTATSANVTVTDVLPTGLGFVSGTGTGWTNCTVATQAVTCVRPSANTIAAAGTAPAITLTVSVAAAAVPSVTNTASVAGGGEPAANNGNNSDSDPTTVIAGNVAPVVDAGGPYTGDEGSAIALNTATATDADAGDTPTYKWTYVAVGTVDPGTSCSFSNDAIVQPTFTCNDDGTFTLTLTVNDGHGHIVPDNATATVANVKPAATAGGPYSGDEGTAIQLAGSGNDPGDNDDDPKLTYLWTVNTTGIDAGGTCTFDDATKKNAKVTCTDNSNVDPFTLTLVATDDDGASSTGSIATLTVKNVNPVADAGGPYDGNEGSAISLNGTVTDAGTNDTHTWSWTYIAGPSVDAGASCSFSSATAEDPTITCTDDGTVELTFTATDGSGGAGSDQAQLTIKNVAPVAKAGGPYSGNEGAAIALAGSATDAGANDVSSYKWTVDVTGIDAGGACTFDDDTKKDAKVTCTDNSNATPFKLTLVATDDDGASSTASVADLTVANVDPVADAGGPYTGDEGAAIPLNGSVTDNGTNDTHTWSWVYVAGAGVDAGATCHFSDAATEDPSITCTDDGEVKLTFTAHDDNGGTGSDEAILTVKNVAPVAHAGGPYPGDEGSAISLAGSATDAGSNDTHTYKWTADVTGIDAGGACTFDDDTKTDAKITCTDDGQFKVKLVATDDDGAASAVSVADLNVANVDPVADAGGDYTGDEGSAIQLSGSVTDAGTNDTHTWSWQYLPGQNVDQGASCSFSPSATTEDPKITCTDDGEVKLTLTAKDDNGGTGTDDAILTLKNVAPVAHAGGPYAGDEGSAIPLGGSATDAGANDVISYKWTVDVTGIDNGGTCTFDNDTKKDATVTCTDNSNATPFKLTLVATDDDGAPSVASAVNLTVANADPIAHAGGPYSGNEGATIQLNGTVEDAGSNDTHTWSWQYIAGTGVDAGATCQFTNPVAEDPKITCTDDGEVKLTLTVKDDNGGTGTDEAILTLANVPPVAHANGPYAGDEGSAILLAGSATDAGANDVISYKWTADVTGVPNGGTCSFDDATKKDAKVTCNDNGTVKLTLEAKDDDGGVDTDEATLTVANVDPVAHAGGPYTGNEGSAVQLAGSATDAGSNDTHTWSWQYVAGANVDAGATCHFSDPAAISPTITCTDDGDVKLTFTVTDDDGGKGADEALLTLANVAPVAHANGPYPGNEGDAIPLSGTATDAGTNDVISYKWTADVTGIDPGGTCTFDDDTKANAKVTCTDNGAFKVKLVATDDDGGTSLTSEANLTVANVDPVADAGGPYTGNEGAAISLNGSVTDAGTNDTHTWSWEYIAGAGVDAGATCHFTDPTAEDPKISCTDDGEVKLTLTAKDDNGGTGTDQAILTLANVAPVAHTNGPYNNGVEGSWTTLNGSATDVGSNDTFTYLWTVAPTGIDPGGSCTFDYPTKKDAKVKCTDDGSFTLTLKVTDDDGADATEQTAFTVANANPVPVAAGPYTGTEGAAIQLNGSATDPGSNDAISYKWTANTTGIDLGGTCGFDNDTKKDAKITCTDDSGLGTFTLTLTAYDDDGGSASNTATLTVQDVKPTIAGLTKPDGTALPATIIVAGTLPIKVAFSDPATNDTHTAQIDCGLGYVSISGNVTTGFQTSCTFATIGPKTVKVKVTDDDGLSDEKTQVITVKYLFDGFYAPVDRPNTMNVSRAGQAIPLKWRLTNANGVPITDVTGVTVQAVGVSCSLSTTLDQIEEYAAGASGLQNLGNGNYQFNWKTPTSYANSCKSIALVFGAGGTSYTENPGALFSFKP